MATFYRVEDEDGNGIYQTQVSFDLQDRKMYQPGPGRDEKLNEFWSSLCGDCQKYRFGFRGKKQLQNWFTPDCLLKICRLSTQYGEGIFVSIYKGPITTGRAQVVFKASEARQIVKISIKDFVRRHFFDELGGQLENN